MIGISYTLSHSLNTELLQIENLRAKIALFPISKSRELHLTFEATIGRVVSGIKFSGIEVPQSLQQDYLQKRGLRPRKKPTQEDPLQKTRDMIIGYRESLDYIRREWLVNSRQV